MADQPNNPLAWDSILEFSIECLRYRNDLISFKFQQMFIEGQLTTLIATKQITFLEACQHKQRVKNIADIKGFIL